jgi:hypothetical protein
MKLWSPEYEAGQPTARPDKGKGKVVPVLN